VPVVSEVKNSSISVYHRVIVVEPGG